MNITKDVFRRSQATHHWLHIICWSVISDIRTVSMATCSLPHGSRVSPEWDPVKSLCPDLVKTSAQSSHIPLRLPWKRLCHSSRGSPATPCRNVRSEAPFRIRLGYVSRAAMTQSGVSTHSPLSPVM